MRLMRAIGVVVLALVLYAALAWPLRHSITDDTYIHLVYAKHFRDGQGLVFNPGQGVYGTTSPLWSLGLGVLGKTGIDLLALAHGLALLFGALTIVATALFLRRFMESWVTGSGYGSGRAELAWALAVVAFGADAWLVRWSATGMETALAAFLVTGGFAAYVGRRPWGNRVLVPAAWWAVASLVRPEAALLILLLLARILLSSSLRSVKLVRAGWALLPVAIVHGPWILYALVVYHTPLPATLAAKTAGGAGLGMFVDVMVRELKALAASRAVELVALIALAPLLVSRFVVRRADHFVPLLWLVGLPLLYAARGVPAISRYLVPVLPVLLAYAWSTFAFLAASERRRPALAVAGLVVAGMLSLGAGLYTYVRFVVPQALAFRSGVEVVLAGMGRWCRDHTPPATEIAIPDIGAFGYYADRPVVDLAGLVTPAITPLLRRYPYDDLVTNLRFEGVARPSYLIDRADMPRRMLFQSPYATVLTPILVGRVDQRGIAHPEPAYYTLYRIDWVAFDRMEGSIRQAMGASVHHPPLKQVLGNATMQPSHFLRNSRRAMDRRALSAGELNFVPPALARSEDRLTAVAPSFAIRWGHDKGMRLDTAKGTYTVDLVIDPDTTIAMPWTDTQLDTLRRAVIDLRLFELPSPHPEIVPLSGGEEVLIRPSFVHSLDIEIDGKHKHFSWTYDSGGGGVPRDADGWERLMAYNGGGVPRQPDEWRRLMQFTALLRNFIARNPAMRQAPPPRGLYQ